MLVYQIYTHQILNEFSAEISYFFNESLINQIEFFVKLRQNMKFNVVCFVILIMNISKNFTV